jgi:hypothetical protein
LEPDPALGQSAPRSRRVPPQILGLGITSLVAAGTALAWPAGSMVAAQPGADVTGDLHWIRLFVVAQGVAFGLFLAALILIRRWPVRLGHVLIIASMIQLVPLAGPLLLSNDAYSYWNAGRLGLHESANPYVDVPASYPDDPSFAFIPATWLDRSTVYGPVFTVLSEGFAVLAGDRPQLAAWLFRALAGASMVSLTFLVARIAPKGAFAAAFVGWNPVFAFQFAGGGHNDALMTMLIVLGLFLIRQGRPGPAGAVWTVSLFVKSLVLVLLPLQALEDRARARPSFVPGLLVAGVTLAIAATWAFGLAWPGAFVPVVESASSVELNSLAIWPRLAPAAPDVIVKIAPMVGFAIAYLFLLREAARGRARHGLATGLFLVASPFLWTWYVLLPAALAPAEDDRPALLIALGLSAYTGLYLGGAGNVFDVLLR